jgi:hypothetical protein
MHPIIVFQCNYQYPGNGVPVTTVWMCCAHAAILSHVANNTWPHHEDGSRAATWPGKTISYKVSTVAPDPYGKVSDPCISVPDLRAGSRTSVGTDRTPGTGPGPLCVGSGPPSAGSRDSGTKNTQALIKAKRGPEPTRVGIIPCTLPLPAQAETRCNHVAYCSWRKPAGGACRKPSGPRGLCIYCGEDAPPGYSADSRCAASAFNVSCPLRWQAVSRPSYRRRACLVHCQTVRPCCKVRYTHHHSYVGSKASAARRYYTGCGYPGVRRLHWRLALVAPNIISIMSLGPHVGAQHPCTCPLQL